MRIEFQDIAEQLLVLLARTALALFLSGILGIGIYVVIAVPVIHSIWQAKDIDFALVAVLTIGFSAGVGSFIAWLDRDLTRSALMLILALTIAASLIGAWIGLQESRDVYKLVGRPGSPTLTRIVFGAMIGGSILNLPLWILKAMRNPRI